MGRWSIASLAGMVALGASACGASAASTPVVGHVRVAIDSGAQFSDFKWTAEHDQVVILQPWETNELRRLKKANPATIVLMYKNAAAASSSVGPGGVYATGVSYKQAHRHRWLLKNRRGAFFRFHGFSWLWAANIGSHAYQRAWVSNVLRDLSAGPWNGVLIDDVNPTIEGHYCVPCVRTYPSDVRYQAAMGSFVEHVGPALQQRGKLAIANLGDWPGHVAVVSGWLAWLSGGMDEQFVKDGEQAQTGYRSTATWLIQLGELMSAQLEGKLFFGLTHSSANDEHAALYGYATALLAGAGRVYYSMSADYTHEPWFPEYDYELGSPTATFSVAPNGVYSRKFSQALVLVNPTNSAQTVNLDGTYSGSGMENVSTVTMSPHSGLILIPNALTWLLQKLHLS